MTEQEICKKIYQLLTACGAESVTYKNIPARRAEIVNKFFAAGKILPLFYFLKGI